MRFVFGSRLKEFLGVAIKDLPRYLSALLNNNGDGYLTLCNRHEALSPAPSGTGYWCNWQWTSVLHAPKVLPFLGRCMIRRALSEHPIVRLSQPEKISQPEVSFIIGHRGTARQSQLLATLESIAGQRGVSCECLVVEQEWGSSGLTGRLPSWVRHIHTPPPTPDMLFCRSWAFNVGYRHSKGRILVLHDNDMLVPADYASQILARVHEGFEVMNLKRFIFHLSELHTRQILSGQAEMTAKAPETIVQNLEAGGSIAITRESFEHIGGMDESFIGWGGEDNEFWERAQTCKVWPYGCLPLVHLWHPAQQGKYQLSAPTLQHYRELSSIPAIERSNRLLAVKQGEMSGPWGYA